MATKIKIGHASTDSASSAANEVLIVEDYDIINGTYALKPTVVLRPKSLKIAESSALACEVGCKNNKIEYSQTYRNTLNEEAKKSGYNLENITKTCYADCSSFMTVCALAAGANLRFSYMPNCGSMRDVFIKSGDYTALTDKIYLNSTDYLQRGDILVRENFINGSRHTVMVLDNGSKISTTIFKDEFPSDALIQAAFTPAKITLNIAKIEKNSVNVIASLTKIKNGKETALSKANLRSYEWTYTLESLDNESIKPVVEMLKVTTSPYKFTLKKGIKQNCSYRLSLKAKEKDTDAEFNSPKVIVSIISDSGQNTTGTNKKFKDLDITDAKNKCKIFIKIKEAFKQAILYNNK